MEIRDYHIEYIDEIHTYLVNGVITPSVSAICKFVFPEKYSDVPVAVLNNKATFGTNVHNAIEQFENGGYFELNHLEQLCFEQYLKLKEKYQIEVIEQETIVRYEDRYAGRLDMIATVMGEDALIDIKTTAQLDTEYLEWQIGLYNHAYKWLYGIDFEKFYCLWLPKKNIGKLVEIKPKTMNEILEVLDRYEDNRKV